MKKIFYILFIIITISIIGEIFILLQKQNSNRQVDNPISISVTPPPTFNPTQRVDRAKNIIRTSGVRDVSGAIKGLQGVIINIDKDKIIVKANEKEYTVLLDTATKYKSMPFVPENNIVPTSSDSSLSLLKVDEYIDVLGNFDATASSIRAISILQYK